MFNIRRYALIHVRLAAGVGVAGVVAVAGEWYGQITWVVDANTSVQTSSASKSIIIFSLS